MRPYSYALVVVSLLFCACGPVTQPAVVSSPFTPELELLFDDGVDFFAEPASLEGSWRDASIRDTQWRAKFLVEVPINRELIERDGEDEG